MDTDHLVKVGDFAVDFLIATLTGVVTWLVCHDGVCILVFFLLMTDVCFCTQWSQVKVMTDHELLSLACEQFLGKSVTEIKGVILQTLEGHLRSILGESPPSLRMHPNRNLYMFSPYLHGCYDFFPQSENIHLRHLRSKVKLDCDVIAHRCTYILRGEFKNVVVVFYRVSCVTSEVFTKPTRESSHHSEQCGTMYYH